MFEYNAEPMEKTDTILQYTANRTYPIPDKKWKYYQEWHDTLFFHWKVTPALLKGYIPKGTSLDTIDGMAWISLVAFEVRKMRLRNLPPIPFISDFHEINVRTYVVKDGIPGIYMFSIETDKFIEVLISRFLIGLPYQKADMEINKHEVWSFNGNKQYTNLRFNCHAPLKSKSDLDLWLTERHCLYQNEGDHLYRFDIHHKEWELRKLAAKFFYNKYSAGEFALTITPDKMHCCKKLKVLLWPRQKV